MIAISTWMNRDCTIGRLQCGDFHCFTLELPWVCNEQNISCIPDGQYQGRLYRSPRHGDVVLLDNVPNRSYIEIHSGNFTRQVKGCILVGDSITYMDRDTVPDVTNSRKTLNELLSHLPAVFSVNIERV